jgi:hypothetical protein
VKAPQIDLVRAAPPKMELRADADGGMPTMEVRFSTFDTWYEIDSFWEGEFLERTKRGAFAETIREDRDSIKTLFNHGFDPQIGDKVLGQITDLREEPDSPVGVVPLFDTTYNRDLLPGLDAGVYGSSFRFRVTGEEWDDEPGAADHNPRGLPERTITKVRLMEFGPVTFPANPDATAGLRCMTDSYYERLRQRDTSAFEAAVRAAGVTIPDLTGRPGARSAGGGDPDAEPREGEASTPTIKQLLDDGELRLRRILR